MNRGKCHTFQNQNTVLKSRQNPFNISLLTSQVAHCVINGNKRARTVRNHNVNGFCSINYSWHILSHFPFEHLKARQIKTPQT